MPPDEITRLLLEWRNGNQQALNKLTPLVYDELRRLARRYLRNERPGHTLQSTALVHELFLKLSDQDRISWQNRAQFFGIAAQMIRRILVDYARKRHAEKRGSHVAMLSLDEAIAIAGRRDLDLLALDDALESLAKLDRRQSRVVELRFFAGLTLEETAEVLEMSPASAARDWTAAKAWLFRENPQDLGPCHLSAGNELRRSSIFLCASRAPNGKHISGEYPLTTPNCARKSSL